MTTYKQAEKEKSRELIWNHAVESITAQRNRNRILNATYMEHLWLYCQQQLNEKLDIETFVQWKEYADICYGKKTPEELKVAFFCGNEPENDVRHLLRLGVRIENIYAFECDKQAFRDAVSSLHNSYPLLKIYRGKIEDYAELQNTKFDIVYLDFTGTMLKEYKTVAKILDLNTLSDMSILAINTTYPDETDDNINFLANFFYNDKFFEQSVLTGEEPVRQEGDSWFYRVEGCDAYNIGSIDEMTEYVRNNFQYAYSAFQTAFILDYANKHKTCYEVFKKSILSNRLIKENELKKIGDFIKLYHLPLEQECFESGLRLSSTQFIKDGFIEKTENGGRVSRLDALKITEVFLQSPYRHSFTDYSKITQSIDEKDEEKLDDAYEDVDLKKILTEEVSGVIDNLDKWFHGKYHFCDTPMEHLWLELILNQFGHPYHTNVGNHRRYSYKAKTRRMCIDVVTLDKCRALYDWIPMLEYFIHDMQNVNRQMITRMCMDAIDKQLLHIVEDSYYGAALVGINEYDWSKNKVLPNRIEIKVSSKTVEFLPSMCKCIHSISRFCKNIFKINL